MNVRKLYLQRGLNGERWDLNGGSGVYAAELAGLGVTLGTTFYDLQDGFFRTNDEHAVPQSSPTFTLIFLSSPYETYRRFTNWVLASPELYLVYCPFGSEEYLRRVTLSGLTKGEKDSLGWLRVPAALLTLTPWFQPTPAELRLEARTGPRKAYLWDEDLQDYCYVYSDELRYGGDAGSDMSARISPSGHLPAALHLVYHGAIVSPTLRLVGAVSGETYGVCALTASGGVSLSASDTLDYSSAKEDCHVRRISASGVVTDLLPHVDLSNEIYFRIPVTEPVVFSLESDSAIAGTAELTVSYYFRSV